MNKKDKELLLKELSARLSYGVMCKVEHRIGTFVVTDLYNKGNYVCGFFKEDNYSHGYHIEEVKPYLRPMSTMTKEERNEYHSYCDYYYGKYFDTVESIDWLNKKMFDYRTDEEGKTMIEKGLALKAPEGTYK